MLNVLCTGAVASDPNANAAAGRSEQHGQPLLIGHVYAIEAGVLGNDIKVDPGTIVRPGQITNSILAREQGFRSCVFVS